MVPGEPRARAKPTAAELMDQAMTAWESTTDRIRVTLSSTSDAAKPLWAKGLFQPQRPQPVANALVHRPVVIKAHPLDVPALREDNEILASYVDDLPVGMGIKGGIARKLVKWLSGKEEPAGSYDIDVIVLVDEAELTPERSLELRGQVTGTRCGDLVLEAQDVEIHPKEELYEYFITRDVTQNEVLLLKRAPHDALLLFTEACERDCADERATPSVHTLSAGLNLVWDVDEFGRPFVSEHIFTRTLIRYLKGHATQYGVDDDTWAHFRADGLSPIALYKILRHFHDDDAQYNAAVDHLVRQGLLHRWLLRSLGGPNQLWGQLLQAINTACARYGGRLKMSELDPEAVEQWIAKKKAQLGQKLVHNRTRGRRIGFVPLEESVYTLGLVTVPPELHEYVERGATFGAARSAAAAARPARSAFERMLARARSASSARGGAATPTGAPHDAAGGAPISLSTPLLGQQSGSGRSASAASIDPESEPAEAAIRRAVHSESSGRVSEDTMARSHELALTGSPPHEAYMDKLDTGLFQAAAAHEADAAHGRPAGDAQNDPADEMVVRSYARAHLSHAELLSFVLGVIWPFRRVMCAAYLCLFAALGLRLLTSKAEGDALNLLQAGDAAGFWQQFNTVAAVWTGSVVLELVGNVVMQLFARRSMQHLFTRLFNHLIHQDADFFHALTLGEICSRCSGDSLTLKGIISSTLFEVVAGGVQALAAMVLLMVEARALFRHKPSMVLAAPIALGLEVAYSVLFGALFAHPLNHVARSSLGRMYGFLFDTFSQLPTVQALGMMRRQAADYCRFVEHYWVHRLYLDVWLSSERFFSSGVGVVLVLAFIATLADAYEARAVVGMGTIYAVLRYLHAMQRGIKTLSDASARISASLGSVERLVQMHNAGKFVSPRLGASEPQPAPRASGSSSGHGEPSPLAPPAAAELRSITGGVRLVSCHFCFRQKSDVTVLHAVSLQLMPGAIVALTGHSGSGKSTLLKLVQLVYQPFKGTVEFLTPGPPPGGAPPRKGEPVDRHWVAYSPALHDAQLVRDRIAVLSLSTLGVFYATVEVNVACAAAGTREVTSEEVRRACEFVGMDSIVNEKLRDGYYTVIGGPNAIELGEGLLLRISLARVLIRRPRILLVDETDHYCSVLGHKFVKRFLEHVAGLGCAVLVTCWRQQLAKELVLAPPGDPALKLQYFLDAGRIVE